MTAARLTAFALGSQILGTVCLLLNSIRTAVRLPKEGVRLGDPGVFASPIFQWANVVGFAFLFAGFMLQGLALWRARSTRTAPEVPAPALPVARADAHMCDAERRATMRVEYDAVCKLVGPTSTLRFAMLAAFFAFNGLLLNAAFQAWSKAVWLSCVVIASLANVLFGLLEVRTRDAHRRLMQRGTTLEDETHLAIPGGGIFTQERHRGVPLGHGKILISMYFVTGVLWLLISLVSCFVSPFAN
jgi:hypothetical protein